MYACACNIRWSVNVYICIKVAYRERGEKGLWWKSEVICLLELSRFQAGSDLTWFVGVPWLTFATQMNTNFHILSFIRWIFGISFSVSLSLSIFFFGYTVLTSSKSTVYLSNQCWNAKNVIDTNYTTNIWMWLIWYYNDIEVNWIGFLITFFFSFSPPRLYYWLQNKFVIQFWNIRKIRKLSSNINNTVLKKPSKCNTWKLTITDISCFFMPSGALNLTHFRYFMNQT